MEKEDDGDDGLNKIYLYNIMNSSDKPSKKSSRKSSSNVSKEIASLKKEIKELKKDNKKLDAHINTIYKDYDKIQDHIVKLYNNNNETAGEMLTTAEQISNMISIMNGQDDEIIFIKKVMKEKLGINWRRVE